MSITAAQKLSMGLQFISQAVDKESPIQNGFNDEFKRQVGVGKNTVKCHTCNMICCEACMGKSVEKCAKFGRGALDLWMGSGKPCSVCSHGAGQHGYVAP